jgi:hypothetical protein
MPQLELLKKILKSLEKGDIPYMLTGSLVSSFQGSPRSTHDIDIIISIKMDDISNIMKAFDSKRFYISQDSIKEAIINSSQFNVLDIEEGEKIDFWILTGSDFDKSRFLRRQKKELLGLKAYISAPEDTIIQKLVWSKLSGGSEKQYKDALSVYEVQYGKLDIEYMEYWSKKLDIKDIYEKMISEAEGDDRN